MGPKVSTRGGLCVALLNQARAERPAILASPFGDSGYGGPKPSRRASGSRKLPVHSQLCPGGPGPAAQRRRGR